MRTQRRRRFFSCLSLCDPVLLKVSGCTAQMTQALCSFASEVKLCLEAAWKQLLRQIPLILMAVVARGHQAAL